MRSNRSALLCSAVATATTATAVALAAPAAAAPGGPFNTLYSLTSGPCVAVVDSSVKGDAYPGSAAFTVATDLYGVGSCQLTVTLHWRNETTGQTGTESVTPHGPGFWMNDGKSAIFSPGYGEIVGWVTVDQPHLGQSGEVPFTVTPL
ncbi:hypothetical protein IU501_07500 [Nocardia otitidiscaviarum]|uniref:hypothetical protein n=1 Tax=Nocardia otitidiscaviarum TaxID=1823 RepID=UPI0004A7335B|nr:hypothetical protein [Nocardia otitidiscaviarum]MBF6132848.1 hypothetical protein [Nocardia otitidiscaviarum]MBF6486243.1 hypothetical protein [Nocardia otitidiscaviarum]